MFADSDFPYFRGYSRQRGRRFRALAQTNGRTAILFLRRYVVSAAKLVGADLIDIAAPEIANVLTGIKTIKSVAADVGKKKLRKQLGGGTIRKRGIIRRFPPRTSRRCRTRRDNFSKLKGILD